MNHEVSIVWKTFPLFSIPSFFDVGLMCLIKATPIYFKILYIKLPTCIVICLNRISGFSSCGVISLLTHFSLLLKV